MLLNCRQLCMELVKVTFDSWHQDRLDSIDLSFCTRLQSLEHRLLFAIGDKKINSKEGSWGFAALPVCLHDMVCLDSDTSRLQKHVQHSWKTSSSHSRLGMCHVYWPMLNPTVPEKSLHLQEVGWRKLMRTPIWCARPSSLPTWRTGCIRRIGCWHGLTIS